MHVQIVLKAEIFKLIAGHKTVGGGAKANQHRIGLLYIIYDQFFGQTIGEPAAVFGGNDKLDFTFSAVDFDFLYIVFLKLQEQVIF